MKIDRRSFLATVPAAALATTSAQSAPRRTTVAVQGDRFLINYRPTYQGRTYKGMKVEGLLMNSRMTQGIFDDSNPATRPRWRYPDTGKWDPERNAK